MSKTSKMKTYEIVVYRSGCSDEWPTVTVEAETVKMYEGELRFWIGNVLVAAFPKDGWGSVIEQ